MSNETPTAVPETESPLPEPPEAIDPETAIRELEAGREERSGIDLGADVPEPDTPSAVDNAVDTILTTSVPRDELAELVMKDEGASAHLTVDLPPLHALPAGFFNEDHSPQVRAECFPRRGALACVVQQYSGPSRMPKGARIHNGRAAVELSNGDFHLLVAGDLVVHFPTLGMTIVETPDHLDAGSFTLLP